MCVQFFPSKIFSLNLILVEFIKFISFLFRQCVATDWLVFGYANTHAPVSIYFFLFTFVLSLTAQNKSGRKLSSLMCGFVCVVCVCVFFMPFRDSVGA